MNFLEADFIITCDDNFKIYQNHIIVFDKQIISIDTKENILKQYPNCNIQYQGKNSIIMPGLINSHIHLEFSANKTTLQYGNFVQWLYSVIKNREELIEKATDELIENELKYMLQNGTTTIGAISSYGLDINPAISTPINVVYFTEVLGSKAEMLDTLLLDFKSKLQTAISHQKDNFIPAIAIHSPYSTHPFLIREVLNIAKEKNLPVSAHFAESKAENDWLNYSKGEFAEFFNNMLGQSTSLTTPEQFLNQFKNIEHLSFTHCVEANKNELKKIKDLNASIIHCPNSNRLLNNTILNLNYLDKINLAIGTDGLSSNHSLNLFDELRNALYMHTELQIDNLAKKLLLAATKGGAKALGLKKGILKSDYDADIIVLNLPDKCTNVENLATSIILHTPQPHKVYIKGQNELF